MILFSIIKNNNITLFHQTCGAPVRRTGVSAFNLFIPENKIISKDENVIIKYLEILKECFVYCKYEGKIQLDFSVNGLKELKNEYEKKEMVFTVETQFVKPSPVKQEYYIFSFIMSDVYKNLKIGKTTEALLSQQNSRLYHLYLLTCIRYLQSDYGFDIVKRTIELSEAYPKWGKIKCLQLAHYPLNSNYDSFFSLLQCYSISKLITKKEILSKINESFSDLNNTFSSIILNLEEFSDENLKELSKIYKGLNSNLKNYLRLKRYLESTTAKSKFIHCSEIANDSENGDLFNKYFK